MKVRIAVVVDIVGFVSTCGISGNIDDVMALKSARARTQTKLAAQGIVEVDVPEANGEAQS